MMQTINTTDLNLIVDNLSGKIGVAADKLGQVSETLVHEVAAKYIALSIAMVLWVAVFVFAAYMLPAVIGKVLDKKEDEFVKLAFQIILVVLMGIGILICAGLGLYFTGEATAPTLHLVERFL